MTEPTIYIDEKDYPKIKGLKVFKLLIVPNLKRGIKQLQNGNF